MLLSTYVSIFVFTKLSNVRVKCRQTYDIKKFIFSDYLDLIIFTKMKLERSVLLNSCEAARRGQSGPGCDGDSPSPGG